METSIPPRKLRNASSQTQNENKPRKFKKPKKIIGLNQISNLNLWDYSFIYSPQTLVWYIHSSFPPSAVSILPLQHRCGRGQS